VKRTALAVVLAATVAALTAAAVPFGRAILPVISDWRTRSRA